MKTTERIARAYITAFHIREYTTITQWAGPRPRILPTMRQLLTNPGYWLDTFEDAILDEQGEYVDSLVRVILPELQDTFWTRHLQMEHLEMMIRSFKNNPVVTDPSTHIPGLGYYTPEDVESWENELFMLRMREASERWVRIRPFARLFPRFLLERFLGPKEVSRFFLNWQKMLSNLPA